MSVEICYESVDYRSFNRLIHLGDCVYLTGNSLGLQAKKSQQYLNEEMEKWKKTGVQGHFVGDRPWVTIDEVLLNLLWILPHKYNNQ